MRYSEQQLCLIHLQDSYTIMYALLSRQIMDELGAQGEAIVREATRRYGADRGVKRREKHLALGVKINMKSLFGVCSDLPPDPRFRRDRLSLTEEERNSHTLVCPMAEVWDRYGVRKIGRIYCEEFHRACYQAYAFGYTQVNLARTLTEDGDEYCDFHIVLRPDNLPAEMRARCFSAFDPDYQEPQISGVPADGKSGFASLCIRVYYYLLEVLSEQVPEKAQAVMARALRLWAADTHRRLKEQSEKLKERLTLDFAERHFPLYGRIEDDSILPQYSRHGAKALLEKEFYQNLYPHLR